MLFPIVGCAQNAEKLRTQQRPCRVKQYFFCFSLITKISPATLNTLQNRAFYTPERKSHLIAPPGDVNRWARVLSFFLSNVYTGEHALLITTTERAYQKQPTIFQNKKRVLLGETGKEKLPRYYKNIGLGFKTPKEAIEGTYIDKKCPFTGNVSIRGRILSGVVTKMKMQRTIVIRRDYLHYIRKYNRFEKRHKNMSVHLSPCFRDVQIGDIVTVGECRPLSKTVRFNVLKVTKAAGTKKQFQKF
ncbi:40S ribosomal protein S11 [Myotis davidii]|uniref:Small ribosomal subunit protein uS17 n=1 Tax=Myotis davidii TaxID=225400 RepID=L5LR74_MYODS|nr:40S ribosomal protein S11 [Myotis davidii]